MQLQEYKIMSSGLGLKRFTPERLAAHSGIERDTINDWLQQQDGRLVEKTTDIEYDEQGCAQPVWKYLDEKLDEVFHGLVAMWPRFAPELVSAREAEEAFNDDSIRIQIEYYLNQTETAESKEERTAWLAEAREWLDIECGNIQDWQLIGHPAPDNVRAEVDRLRRRLRGFEQLAEPDGSRDGIDLSRDERNDG